LFFRAVSKHFDGSVEILIRQIKGAEGVVSRGAFLFGDLADNDAKCFVALVAIRLNDITTLTGGIGRITESGEPRLNRAFLRICRMEGVKAASNGGLVEERRPHERAGADNRNGGQRLPYRSGEIPVSYREVDRFGHPSPEPIEPSCARALRRFDTLDILIILTHSFGETELLFLFFRTKKISLASITPGIGQVVESVSSYQFMFSDLQQFLVVVVEVQRSSSFSSSSEVNSPRR